MDIALNWNPAALRTSADLYQAWRAADHAAHDAETQLWAALFRALDREEIAPAASDSAHAKALREYANQLLAQTLADLDFRIRVRVTH